MRKKIRIVASALMLLFSSLANSIYAQNSAPAAPLPTASASQNSQVQQQARQLLDWFGILTLLEQTPLALTNGLEAEAKFRQATLQQRDSWRRELESKLKPTALQQALVRYVAERYRADAFQRADELLQQPLAKRARFFDLAMTQTSAAPGLRDYRAQLRTDPQANRRAIVQELDEATATSLLAAILQTVVGERIRQIADTGTTAPSGADLVDKTQASTQEFLERQRFLAPLTEEYLLYTYRYFKDDELVAYRDLMRDAQLQWLLDVSRQGVIAVLQGAN